MLHCAPHSPALYVQRVICHCSLIKYTTHDNTNNPVPSRLLDYSLTWKVKGKTYEIIHRKYKKSGVEKLINKILK